MGKIIIVIGRHLSGKSMFIDEMLVGAGRTSVFDWDEFGAFSSGILRSLRDGMCAYLPNDVVLKPAPLVVVETRHAPAGGILSMADLVVYIDCDEETTKSRAYSAYDYDDAREIIEKSGEFDASSAKDIADVIVRSRNWGKTAELVRGFCREWE